MARKKIYFISFFFIVGFLACEKVSQPTPYEVVRPYKFPVFENDVEKNITKEGITLGRRLFYDRTLSGNGTMSCATCHVQEDGFSDKKRFSIGIDGSVGKVQAMPIINLIWSPKFFWNGRTKSLEEQALEPVTNPIEMNAKWPNVIEKIKAKDIYVDLFAKAFPKKEITKELVANAIAQFEKTLISKDSKFDKMLQGQYTLTEQEERGRELFFSERGDCFHCHSGTLVSDLQFHNNGLDVNPDLGLQKITQNPNDRGKFKTPTLRNIAKTAPYMHDGRFATLDEVIDFYSSGVKVSPTTDDLMKQANNGGVQLTAAEKEDLKAYLLILTDETFLSNPDFASPF